MKSLINSRVVVAVVSMGLCGCAGGGAAGPRTDAESPLWGSLEPGPFEVGFTALFVVDSTRGFPTGDLESTGRPLRILLWYPARPTAGGAERMTFGDYLQVSPPEERFRPLADYLRARDHDTAKRQFSPVSDSLLRVLLGTPVAARRDAAGAEGHFPLVLHSLGGNDYQLESTVLWEYLAAHGYVVAVLPQLGPSLEDGTLAFSPEDLALQSEDLEFALEVLSEAGVADGPLPSLETDRIGVVGHSSGGIAALLLAGRSRRVAAIAGLDPSFTTGEGAALLDRMSFDYASVTAALLDLRANANGILDLDPLNAMRHADRYDAAIGGERPPRKATHFDFQNWPLYGVLTGVEDDRGASARPAAQGRAVYLAVCRLTRAFFDVVLRGRRDAAGYLTGDTPLPPPDPTIAFGRYPAEP